MSRWSQDGCWGFGLRRGGEGGGDLDLGVGGAIKRCRARPQFPQAQMPSSKEPLSAAKQDFAADLPSNVAFRQWQLTIVNLDLCQKLTSIFLKRFWIERRRKNVRFHPCWILNDLKTMCKVLLSYHKGILFHFSHCISYFMDVLFWNIRKNKIEVPLWKCVICNINLGWHFLILGSTRCKRGL